MKLQWTEEAWEDYLHWQETDRSIVRRINELLKDARRSPFKGIGKPEPLKGDLSGWWSRRINKEHRLIYRVRDEGSDRVLEILQCRYHY